MGGGAMLRHECLAVGPHIGNSFRVYLPLPGSIDAIIVRGEVVADEIIFPLDFASAKLSHRLFIFRE